MSKKKETTFWEDARNRWKRKSRSTKKKNFFKRHKDTIVGLSSIVQALMIVALVWATLQYAGSTKDMAMPYIGIISETSLRKGDELYFMPRIANSGNVSVEITSIETDIPGFVPFSDTIILLPRQERVPSMEIDKPNLNQDLFFTVKIKYGSLFDKKSYCISYDYEIKGGIRETIYLKNSGKCDPEEN